MVSVSETADVSRDKLLLSGQDGRTDEPTRRLEAG
jgi:hypothetical protein